MTASASFRDSSFAPGQQAAAERAARAYAEALRHSRTVRRLRKIIPVAAVTTVGLLTLAPYLSPLRNIGNLGLGPVSLSGTRVTMEHPKLTGFRKDNKPYELIAVSATQDIRKPNQIELNDMTARLAMEANGWATLSAKTGMFESQKEQMQLRGGIKVKTDTGYDVTLKSADIDFKAGTVVSREHVNVISGGMTVDADTLDVTDNGKAIAFKGNVKTVIVNSGVQLAPASDSNPAGAKP